MRWRERVLAASVVALVAACSDDECQRHVDCRGFNMVCVEGSCQAAPQQPNIVVDSGPRPPVGFPDASDGDASDSGELDTGFDAGTSTSADGGPSDAGDAGPSDLGPGGPIALGEIWVYQRLNPGTGTLMEGVAEMYRYDAVPMRTTFSGGNVDCVLTDRTAIVPTRVGIGGSSIDVSGFETVLTNDRVRLLPTAPGQFASGPQNTKQLFRDPGVTLTWTINPGTAGQITSATAMTRAATSLSITSPPTVMPVNLRMPITVEWEPRMDVMPARTITLELADPMRTLVLRCETGDARGSMTVPEAARSAFLASGVMGMVSLDLFHEELGAMSIPINGGGTVLAVLRASAGARFSTVY